MKVLRNFLTFWIFWNWHLIFFAQVVVTGPATSFTLHESRLKIIFRSVESDSESSSEVTKLRLRISDSFWIFLKPYQKNSKRWEKKSNFRKESGISQHTVCTQCTWVHREIRRWTFDILTRKHMLPLWHTKIPLQKIWCAILWRGEFLKWKTYILWNMSCLAGHFIISLVNNCLGKDTTIWVDSVEGV